MKFRYADRVQHTAKVVLPPAPTNLISFGSGDAFPPALPDMVGAARQALSEFRSEVLQYAPRLGLPELRRWVADYLRSEDVLVTPQHILITNGAKHGLDLTCKVLLNPGDTVVVTKPTYMTVLPIFREYGARFLEIDQDGEGMRTDQLRDRLKEISAGGGALPTLVYNVPEFHNPTGVTMSQHRRAELIELAEEYSLVIVEDDPYRRIRFEGSPVPPVQSLDRSGRVVGIGTFSKLIAPGLRIGWVACDSALIEKMGVLKSDGGSSALPQRMILEYWRAGYGTPHIAEVVSTYRHHRDIMLEAIAAHLPEAKLTKPQGGYYLWLQLPEPVDTDKLLAIARRRGVEFIPASAFYATTGPTNYLRLAYSYATPDAIAVGIQRLRDAITDSAEGRSSMV